ncbi:alpha/beta-hydrolase [Trametopsis cervina]|nr:alpha/beta-hydrolase [Trametopsis cervina]
MNPTKYKTTTTTQGFTYNYYFAPAQPSKPTLLFCHGFPSTSIDWEKEATFFEGRGYGVIVPDMLGYGDTSKPIDVNAYVPSVVSKDLVEILDAEGVQRAIAIGHDWGSKVVSRLANHYPERFYAYAFFAVSFVPVTPPVDYDEMLVNEKAKYGSVLNGFWGYLATNEFDPDFRAHPDAAFNILYPSDLRIWATDLSPVGALKQTLLSNYKAPLATYVDEDFKRNWISTFMKNGFEAPTRWYAVMTTKKSAEDDIQTIPEGHRIPPVNAPIFFGAAKGDRICLPQIGYVQFAAEEFKDHNVTIHEFDGGHWIVLSHADEINEELLRWVEGTVSVVCDFS